jgi:hypothetical protein
MEWGEKSDEEEEASERGGKVLTILARYLSPSTSTNTPRQSAKIRRDRARELHTFVVKEAVLEALKNNFHEVFHLALDFWPVSLCPGG